MVGSNWTAERKRGRTKIGIKNKRRFKRPSFFWEKIRKIKNEILNKNK